VRNVPSRISPETFPIAATATAPAYDYEPAQDRRPAQARAPEPVVGPGQQPLFSNPVSDSRVIPFDSLTTQAERESIRARAADLARPAPIKTARVEVRRARPRKTNSRDQRTLDFQRQEDVLVPQSNIICDAPVAPPALRAEAALIDGLVIFFGCAFGAGLFLYGGGQISLDRHVLLFLLLSLITVPLWYKLLWTAAGRDTFGMQRAGIRLVDFDGNPPSQQRRYQRLVGSILSSLAAGVGLIWALVDEDGLTWHDHISGTFPTMD
jgi:uncharacterized RDD family membrane protein YckC